MVSAFFFDAAGNIRAEDMRQLWARVLAGEIEHPGSFSLRTVEVLRNMSQAEALAFKNASSLVLEETDGSQFLFCDSDLSDYTINQRETRSGNGRYFTAGRSRFN